jgi:molecular chaperone GrpE
MNKRFKDDNNDHSGHSADDRPIITLDPEAEVSKGSRHGGPIPLTVEETVEVLAELDKLNEQVQDLTKRIQDKDQEIARLGGQPNDADSSGDSAPRDSAIKDKDQEIAELKDKYLRTLAEAENARRRIRQQSEDSVRVQRENLLRDLLPIVDNLERAVSAAKANGGGNGKSIVEGVEMVLASLMDFLKSNGVRPQPSVGQAFDPTRHEAADHVDSSKHPANTIVEEFHRGYMISDRVLRPARVSVAKGAAESASRKNGE